MFPKALNSLSFFGSRPTVFVSLMTLGLTLTGSIAHAQSTRSAPVRYGNVRSPLARSAPGIRSASAVATVSMRIEPFTRAVVSQGESLAWVSGGDRAGADGYRYHTLQVDVASNTPWQVSVDWLGDALSQGEEISAQWQTARGEWQRMDSGGLPTYASSKLGYQTMNLVVRYKLSPSRSRFAGRFGVSTSGSRNRSSVSVRNDQAPQPHPVGSRVATLTWP